MSNSYKGSPAEGSEAEPLNPGGRNAPSGQYGSHVGAKLGIPKGCRGFQLTFENLHVRGHEKLRKRMDALLQDNFPLMSLFGCNIRFELTFFFAMSVALLHLGLFIFCLVLLNKTGQQDGAQDGKGSYSLLLGIGLSASLGVIYMTHKLSSSDTKHASLYNKIYVPFQKEVEHMLQDIKAVMCRELDTRIDEVRLIYKVIGSCVRSTTVLAQLLVKANSRTCAALNQLSTDNGVPTQQAFADYFKRMTSDYKTHLALDKERMKQEKESLGSDEMCKAGLKEPLPSMGESSASSTAPTDVENPPEGTATEMNSGPATSEPKRAKSNDKYLLRRTRSLYEEKIRTYVQTGETPTVRLETDNDEKHTIDFKKPEDVALPDRPIELAAIETFFQHNHTSAIEGGGVAIYQSFLEIKYREEDSKYIEELEKTRNQLESLCGQDGSIGIAGWKDKIKPGLDDDKSKITTWCLSCFRCCRNPEAAASDDDATSAESQCYESCRSAVKFRVIFWTVIIAIAQIAYAILLYINSKGDLDDAYLVIPLAFIVLAIQAILFIPCYTDSDSEKAKKLMLNFVNHVYDGVVNETSTKIAGLADQEKFMTELTDIQTDNNKATESITEFDDIYDRAFNFVLTLVASFQGHTDPYRMIRAVVDPENATLSLTLEETNSPPDKSGGSHLKSINSSQIPKTGDTRGWKGYIKRFQTQLNELEAKQAQIKEKIDSNAEEVQAMGKLADTKRSREYKESVLSEQEELDGALLRIEADIVAKKKEIEQAEADAMADANGAAGESMIRDT